MKKNYILIIIFVMLLCSLFVFNSSDNKDNIIKSITFNQIEDKNAPLKYKKEYILILSKLSKGKKILEFNSSNHFVEVFVNNELIYELKEEKDIVHIPLKKDYLDKQIRIILIPMAENNNDLNLEIK